VLRNNLSEKTIKNVLSQAFIDKRLDWSQNHLQNPSKVCFSIQSKSVIDLNMKWDSQEKWL